MNYYQNLNKNPTWSWTRNYDQLLVCQTSNYNNGFPQYPQQEALPTNRFIFVNQHVTNTSKLNTNMGVRKVLINPNFKSSIHINPNFKKLESISKTIHVNPEILNSGKNSVLSNYNKLIESKVEAVHKVEERSQFTKSNNNKKLIRSYFLKPTVNLSKPQHFKASADVKLKENPYCSRYKLVRSETNRANISKFKIDRRINQDRGVVKRNIKIDAPLNFRTRYVFIKHAKLNRNKNLYVNNKILKRYSYKKGQEKKFKIIPTQNKLLLQRKKLIRRHLTHKLLSTISKYKIIKTKQAQSKKILLKNKCQIKNNKKLKKCNLPCPIYQKYGRCKVNETGKCIKIHDPNQISLCAKFLQGACIEKNCLLSHKISAEKMPTCKYFLEGRCFRDDCQYLHVKVNPKADICKDFLDGFCQLGKDCGKRHQYLCPDFEKNNICRKVKCPYPHGNMVRNIRLLNKFAKIINKNTNTIDSTKVLPENSLEDEKTKRYYIDDLESTPNKQTNCDIDAHQVVVKNLTDRPKLGQLPSFIPFI